MEMSAGNGFQPEEGEPQPNVYCWTCAKGQTNIRCTKCPRQFHDACVKDHRGTDWMCKACTAGGIIQFDVKFIPNILDTIIADDKFTLLTSIQFNAEQTQYPIDIPRMMRKSYETAEQFLDDLAWFYHNCRTMSAFDRKLQAAIKRLRDYVNNQMEDIGACGECYENACNYGWEKSLVMACAKPHLLLWSHDKYGCYCPTKLMAIDVKQNKAIVRLFGDCSKATTCPSYCYLYSEEHPKKKAGLRRPHEASVQDANKYIKNVRLQFGNFNFAKHLVTFAPKKLPEYLEQMVAENPSADFDGNESNASEVDENQMEADSEVGEIANQTNRNRMPKRSARSSSSSAARAKKIRSDSEVDTIFDTMESNFKKYAERETWQMKHDIGQHLQNRLDEMNNAKHALEQTISTLNTEKGDLERDYVDLEKQLTDVKIRFDEKIAALEETHRQEKASLEEKVAALELKKNEMNCAHCHVALQQVVLCSSECGKKHYTNCQ